MTFCKKEKIATKTLFEKAKERDYNRLIERINNTKIKTASDVWQLRDTLNKVAKEFDTKYDYRYSVMLENFVTFILEELISLKDLEFLSEDKYQYVENYLQTIQQFQTKEEEN
jgi:hypothetical protein